MVRRAMLSPAVRLQNPDTGRPERAPGYTLADLGCHLDGSPLLPVAINDSGEIAACAAGSHPAGIFRGFHLAGRLCVPSGVAFGAPPVAALSANGLLAGAAGTAPKALCAWASHRDIFGERLWPGCTSRARSVNARGDVAGDVHFEAGELVLTRAFLLPAAGAARLLTPPQGGTTTAAALNDAGDLAFNATPLGADAGTSRAWLLQEHTYVPIPGLGGGSVWARALTPGGRVVGRAETVDGSQHAFLWEDGTTLDLGAPVRGLSEGLAADDHGVVVGRMIDALGAVRACRWTRETGLQALADVVRLPAGWVLHEAVGINSAGDIVGTGTWFGRPRGFRLRPDPSA